jgi:PAS domain S-box-containing protein
VLTDIEDRKHAEDLLRMREDHLRRLVDGMPGFVFASTAEGEIEFVNQRIINYTGRTLEELKRWAITDLVHPEDLPRVLDELQRSIETGQSKPVDHRVRGADGSYRWFQARRVPERDPGGRIVRWYLELFDIHDLKATEHSLRRSEADLLEGQRLTHSLSWKFDVSSRKVTNTPEANRIYRFKGDEDPSDPELYFGMMHPDDRTRVREHFERCTLLKINFEADYAIILPDGNIRHMHATGHPVLNESGDLVEWVGTTMDVTEQWQARNALEQANRALQASERELTLIIETIPAFVWCASIDGQLTYVNRRLVDYIGAPMSALCGQGWIDFVHPDDRSAALERWLSSVASGDPLENQYRLRRADGAYRWIHAPAQLGQSADGRPTLWYGLMIDIDDRKNVEEALRLTQAKLSRAAQVTSVGELAASIAHEINQPLAAVVTNGNACLRWLSAGPSNVEKAREAAERIVRCGMEAGEVIRRIRSLFKSGAFDKTALDLNDIIGEVLRLLGTEIDRKRVSLETKLETGLPLAVGDRVQLQQLALNLILNGIEAMDSVTDRRRTLFVGSGRIGDSILVEVRDSGVGLSEPDRIFDAFFTTKKNGLGMGLAICRSIVEAHNGKLWTSSVDGAGSAFYFSIPVEDAAR